MSAQILATKLYLPPPRPNTVRRPQLIERLSPGLHRKLTLISAPAGFGKTTIASAWVAATGRPTAWLSLDDGDNDLNQFLTYLVAALQTVIPDLGAGVLELLEAPPPLPTEPVLTTLLNDISAAPDPLFLVLDDFHLIDAQPVHNALAFLLERLPPQLQLVIATREDPALPLARLRVRGELTELRAADLRFAPAEAAEFLNRAMGLDLSADAVATLEARTEGWIAGLQLAALALQGTNASPGPRDAPSFIRAFSGSHRFVLDYLVEEVLQQQPESVQTFLLRTSVLERLCGPLCDAVLGDAAAPGQETLEYLERANLLVVPLDDRRQWYRYHHLFADVLRARLQKEQPQLVAALHRGACEWYDRRGLSSEAIRHALAAEDFDRAADLIELAWSDIRRSCFRSPTWLGWVKALPDDLIRVRPVLSVGCALELLNFGEVEAAGVRIRESERWLEPGAAANRPADAEAAEMVVVNEAEFASLRGLLAATRGFHAQALGDVSASMEHAQRALTLASAADFYARGVAGSVLGLGYWTLGELEAAHEAMAAAMTSLQQAGNVLFAISTAFVRADIRTAQGRLGAAIDIYEQALQLATAQGEGVLQGAADLYLGLAELHHERGDREGAGRHLRTSEALGERVALPHWPFRRCLVRARMRQGRADLDGALELLAEAERLGYGVPAPDVRPVAAWRARVWIAQGRLDEAEAWARERALSVDDDLSYLREFEHLTLARLLLARYRTYRDEPALRQAEGLLERLLEAAQVGERRASTIEVLVLQALAREAQDDVPAAVAVLERALELAEPEGYVRIFVDEGAPLARLLPEAAGRGVLPGYLGRLLAALERDEGAEPDEGPASRLTASDSAPTSELLLEPLSERELEVLRLIADGLSNREISKRLFRALSTVKGHNRNIFGKLQVRSRTAAVARARELGLL